MYDLRSLKISRWKRSRRNLAAGVAVFLIALVAAWLGRATAKGAPGFSGLASDAAAINQKVKSSALRYVPGRYKSASIDRQAPQVAAPRQWVEMRNVDLGVSDSVTVRIQMLHGEVIRTDQGRPATLDDPRSFRIRVTAGRVAMTGADLGGALNTVVFGYPGAPLRDLQVRTDSQEIIQTGILHKGVDLRFRLRGVISLMPDGRVRIHPTSVRALGLNGKRALGLVGLHLDNLLDLRGAHGASVKGDDLYLDPVAILPAPGVTGRLATIGIEGDRVTETFVQDPDDSVFRRWASADTTGPGFVYFRGGELGFGKMLMSDADLRIVDNDSGSPFGLNLPHYRDELVAGRPRVLRNQGLVVSMPDYDSLRTQRHQVGATLPKTPGEQQRDK